MTNTTHEDQDAEVIKLMKTEFKMIMGEFKAIREEFKVIREEFKDIKGEFKSLHNTVDRIRWHFYLVGFSVLLAASATIVSQGIHPTMSALFK